MTDKPPGIGESELLDFIRVCWFDLYRFKWHKGHSVNNHKEIIKTIISNMQIYKNELAAYPKSGAARITLHLPDYSDPA